MFYWKKRGVLMKKEKWIIAACSSEGDGIEFLRIDGSIRLIKEKLINMVKKIWKRKVLNLDLPEQKSWR